MAKITRSDIVSGARFKAKSGTVFIVDSIENDPKFGILVKSSFEGGAKGNYRDPIDEFVAFMNEMNATKIMARGGFVGKGEHVWKQLSASKRMEFLQEYFTPEITPRSQEILIGKAYNFLPKNVKIKLNAVYADVEDYARGGVPKGLQQKRNKVGQVMHEFKEGKLHSGSRKGPIVTDRDQAIAIALSEAGLSKKMAIGGFAGGGSYRTGEKVMVRVRGNEWETGEIVRFDPKSGSYVVYLKGKYESQFFDPMDIKKPTSTHPFEKWTKEFTQKWYSGGREIALEKYKKELRYPEDTNTAWELALEDFIVEKEESGKMSDGGSMYADGGWLSSFNPKSFTLDELRSYLSPDVMIYGFMKGWSGITPAHENKMIFDYPNQRQWKQWKDHKFTISDYGHLEVEKGSENLYLDLIVYELDGSDDPYTIRIYTKDNHKGLKEFANHIIYKLKDGGSMYADGGGSGNKIDMTKDLFFVVEFAKRRTGEETEIGKEIFTDRLKASKYFNDLKNDSSITVASYYSFKYNKKGDLVSTQKERQDYYAPLYYKKNKMSKGGSIKVGDRVRSTTFKGVSGTILSKNKNGYYFVRLDEKLPNGDYQHDVLKIDEVEKMSAGGSAMAEYLPVSEELRKADIDQFIEYVNSFYGKDEDAMGKDGYTKAQIKTAINKYVSDLGKEFTWGYGDSLDRERVYEYLRNPKQSGIVNPSFAEGGPAGGVTEKITKAKLKAKLYNPTGDFFIEDKGDKWFIHFTPKDADRNSQNLSDLNAERVGDGYYGSAYSVEKVIKHSYSKGGSTGWKHKMSAGGPLSKGDIYEGREVFSEIGSYSTEADAQAEKDRQNKFFQESGQPLEADVVTYMKKFGDREVKIIKVVAFKKHKMATGGTIKVGDVISEPLNNTYEESWQIFKPVTSYILDRKTKKVISIHSTPYQAIEEKQKLELKPGKSNAYSVHWETLPTRESLKMALGGKIDAGDVFKSPEGNLIKFTKVDQNKKTAYAKFLFNFSKVWDRGGSDSLKNWESLLKKDGFIKLSPNDKDSKMARGGGVGIVKLGENPFELYDNHPEYKEAERAIRNGIRTGKITLKNLDFNPILRKYRSVGADDSEARERIYLILKKEYKMSAGGGIKEADTIMYVELQSVANEDFDDPGEKRKNIGTKKAYVGSIEEAQSVVREFIDRHDLGGGNWTGGKVFKDGKNIGYIAYNGRFFEGERSFADGGNTKKKLVDFSVMYFSPEWKNKSYTEKVDIETKRLNDAGINIGDVVMNSQGMSGVVTLYNEKQSSKLDSPVMIKLDKPSSAIFGSDKGWIAGYYLYLKGGFFKKKMSDGGSASDEYSISNDLYVVYFTRFAHGRKISSIIYAFDNKEEAENKLAERIALKEKGWKVGLASKMKVDSEVRIDDPKMQEKVNAIVHSEDKVNEYFKGSDSFYRLKWSWVLPNGYKWDNYEMVKNNQVSSNQKMAKGGAASMSNSMVVSYGTINFKTPTGFYKVNAKTKDEAIKKAKDMFVKDWFEGVELGKKQLAKTDFKVEDYAQGGSTGWKHKMARGGSLSDLEKKILIELHLQGYWGKSGNLTTKQRLKYLQGLQNKGYIDSNADLTPKGKEEINL